MIKLTRKDGSGPVSLSGPARVQKNLALIDSVLRGRAAFESGYWKAAKNALRDQTAGKCAYCEAPTSVVAHGDVEHFRPKNVYWWLAYCYHNYLFACQICNQSHKGDHFPVRARRMTGPLLRKSYNPKQLRAIAAKLAPDPLDGAAGMSHTQFESAARAEEAGLLDPYLFDPEEYFAWEADSDLKEVRITAAKKKAGAAYALASAEEYLGLNREELRRVRFRTYEKLETYRRVLESRLSSTVRQQVQRQVVSMMSDASEFAGMVRFFARTWRIAP